MNCICWSSHVSWGNCSLWNKVPTPPRLSNDETFLAHKSYTFWGRNAKAPFNVKSDKCLLEWIKLILRRERERESRKEHAFVQSAQKWSRKKKRFSCLDPFPLQRKGGERKGNNSSAVKDSFTMGYLRIKAIFLAPCEVFVLFSPSFAPRLRSYFFLPLLS